MQKLYQKNKDLLKNQFPDGNYENRYFVVQLGNASNNERNGYLSALYEITEGEVTEYEKSSINKIYNERELKKYGTIFVRADFDQYVEKYNKNELFIVQAHPLPDTDGDCLYGVFYDIRGIEQHYKLEKNNPFIARLFDNDDIEINTDNLIKNEEKIIHLKKTNENINSDTPLCFYRDGNDIYGPFFDKKEKTLQGTDLNYSLKIQFMKGKKVSDYKIYKINVKNSYLDENLKIENNSYTNKKYLINIALLFTDSDEVPNNNSFEIFDTIFVEQILKKSSRLLKTKPIQKINIDTILSSKELNELSEERKNILGRVFNTTNNHVEQSKKLIREILESKTFDSEIHKSFSQKPEEFLERFSIEKNDIFTNLKNQFDTEKKELLIELESFKENKKNTIENELGELNSKKNVLFEKLDISKKELSILEQKLEDKKTELENSESIQHIAAEKSQLIKELTVKLNELKTEYNLANNIKDLKEEFEYIKRRSKEEEQLKDELEKVTKKIKEEMDSELARKFLESKIISDLVTGDYHKHLKKSLDQENQYISTPPLTEYNDQLNRNNLVDIIHERLLKMNRKIDKGLFSLYLTAVYQNQFTVLIGSPGSGKTSFAKQLTHAFGSHEETLSSLINVGKGWTEPKVLQGFYNPITKSYDSGNTGFYDLIKTLNQAENEDMLPPSFIIYDEFNLSSPEYYLSDQLYLADKNTKRKIKFSNEEQLNIPLSTRIICTANTDESVQGLTPRVINRCAFIRFKTDYEAYSFENTELVYQNFPFIATGKQITDIFTPNAGDVVSEDIKYKLEELYEIFIEKLNCNLSIRRKEKIKTFVLTSSDLKHVNENLILDLTIEIFLLPLISGTGLIYLESLTELSEQFDTYELNHSLNSLNEIIEIGKSKFNNFYFSMS